MTTKHGQYFSSACRLYCTYDSSVCVGRVIARFVSPKSMLVYEEAAQQHVTHENRVYGGYYERDL